MLHEKFNDIDSVKIFDAFFLILDNPSLNPEMDFCILLILVNDFLREFLCPDIDIMLPPSA